MTNKGDDIDLAALVLLDPETGKTEMVESDPLKRVDFGGAMFSEVTDELALTLYMDDKLRALLQGQGARSRLQVAAGKVSGQRSGLGLADRQTSRSGSSRATSDTEPGETYLFDRKTKKLTLQYRVREKLPREALAQMKPIHYKSSDGLEIPAYLTLPKGVPGEESAVIVFRTAARGRATSGATTRSRSSSPIAATPCSAELPRLDRLRQEVPQRRQRRVGQARCRTTSPGA